ncbi:CPBP family glutamic-type intramembrane protease [Dyella telluris]|uniref:CPBP family intramembrane metalloprotease n=1 Tax=Dyella telluris TaxID=2763498 RepID=A0A7G8Q2I4_9GAMM|nr:CPBP family glutamic-type intramembrane protease [Dyella telluris]QNK00992.1 CPBP family intramembrane metalloprotease [Dyella telluris]
MSAPRTTPPFLAIAGFLAAVAVLLWCMAGLSGWMTRGQLVHEAARVVAALHAGEPPWAWALRRPSDLVASRVFGHATLAATPDGLTITSADGTPFELGLPLAGPVDLTHWPTLRIQARADHRGRLGLSYQSLESSEACTADQVATVPADADVLSINLQAPSWHTAQGKACPPPGVVAYMLRLRVTLPAGSTWTVGSVTSATPMPVALPAHIDGHAADIRLTGTDTPATWQPAKALTRQPTPIVRLPEGASAEAMLLLRDRIRHHWPAAIILPFGAALPSQPSNRMPLWLDAGVCGIYLAWLVWLAVRQRPGVIRPWTEVAAIAFGPLWLIAGLRWGPQPSMAGIVAFVAALVYGGQSEWRRQPVEWGWWSRNRSDWLYPLLPLPVAAGLMLADGHHLLHLEPRHILAYLGWALLQQWAMLALVLGRLERTGLPRAAVIMVTAVLFGLLHTPNGSLMQLCLVAELWWAWCFMRSPRLIPIALAHAASALLVESGLTGHLLRSLEVSARFFL